MPVKMAGLFWGLVLNYNSLNSIKNSSIISYNFYLLFGDSWPQLGNSYFYLSL